MPSPRDSHSARDMVILTDAEWVEVGELRKKYQAGSPEQQREALLKIQAVFSTARERNPDEPRVLSI